MNQPFKMEDVLESLFDGKSEPELKRPVVRPIRNMVELQQVYRLTHDNYLSSGYSEAHATRMIAIYPRFDHVQQTTILIAVLNGEIIGSISLTTDGPGGFTIDDEFKDACDAIRREELPCGSIWRLVVEESARSRSAVISLMIGVRDLMIQKRLITALLAVNPKHESVYKRMLNASVVAQSVSTKGLANAPAVVLRFNPNKLPPQSPVAPKQNEPEKNGHTIYNLIRDSDY